MLRSVPEIAHGERSKDDRAEEVILAGCDGCDGCYSCDCREHCGRKVVFHNYFLSVTLIFGYKKCTLFGCGGHFYHASLLTLR